MYEYMKVLVVGGAGYIGGGIVDVLLEKGISFTVYDNLLYEYQYLKQVDFIRGDVRDFEALEEILPEYTHVIWLAAIVGDAACQIKPDLTVAVNQESVKWVANNYDGRIIFPSTCSVYGQNDQMIDENSSANPLSIYAEAKLGAERYLYEGSHLILRLGTVYGVSDASSRLRMDLVVNYMTASALTKGKLSVFGGTQWRPLIHVKDVAEAMVDNLAKETTGIYNLSTLNLQIRDLAKIVSDMTGCTVEYTPQNFEDRRNYHVSNEKAIRDGVFRLEGNRDIAYGIGEIADLIRSGRIKYAENDVYFNERHIASLYRSGEFV